jgi:hypothetical protein
MDDTVLKFPCTGRRFLSTSGKFPTIPEIFPSFSYSHGGNFPHHAGIFPNGHYYLQAATPDQITQQDSLQRALMAVKALNCLISRQIVAIFKNPMSQETGRRLEGNPGIVSIGQF